MDLGITHKKALIVGAEHDLAQAIAVDLAKEGVSLTLVFQKSSRAPKILQKLGGSSKGHQAVSINLARAGQAEVLRRKLSASNPIDIIVNCLDMHQPAADASISIAQWRKIFRNNLEIAIEVNNAFIPQMKKQGWGRIVNLSSGAAMEHSDELSYCTSKAALTAYTRCMGRILAIEANNVVMSAVLPGVVVKGSLSQIPAGRLGKLEEISPMVVMLCSNQASYCHGAIVPLDGGQARHYYQTK